MANINNNSGHVGTSWSAPDENAQSNATTKTAALASIPDHIDAKNFKFAGLPAPRFMLAGGLSPLPEHSRVIDFSKIPKGEHIFNDIHSHFDNYTGDGHFYPEVCAAADMVGVKYFTLTPIPTTVVPKMNDNERFKLVTDCGQTYYVDSKWTGKALSKEMVKRL
jgi:hypothetical protein